MSKPNDYWPLPWRLAPLKGHNAGAHPKLRRTFTEDDARSPRWLEMTRAECWLRLARQHPGNRAAYIARMEMHRQKARASYADIGTSEEEIASLR